MELSINFFSLRISKHPNLRTFRTQTLAKKPRFAFVVAKSADLCSPEQLAHTLQTETLETLEWSSLCKQLSPFTSTSMGYSATQEANIPIGGTLEESQRLLDQTTGATAAMEAVEVEPLLKGIEDVSRIVDCAMSGELLSINDLCTVRRTLRAAMVAWEKLEEAATSAGDYANRYTPLLELLRSCNFQMELERKIEFCIDCSLSLIMDRASEDLEIIRVERKSNMENLDSLLKDLSTRIFQAGGIERTLITRRRSRMCVGIRASHKSLLPGGVVLGVSSSGATYFMEPKEAVELNNLEVWLADSEKAEEMTILSFLTSEVASSGKEIKYVLDRVLEVDLAFARAAYAQWMNAVCPILSSKVCDRMTSSKSHHSLLVDIEGIQHPLLLGSSLRTMSGVEHKSRNLAQLKDTNLLSTGRMSKSPSNFPVPIDIKVECRTRVVVMSGPNTGGKTASMKTLGLASLMSKAGMYLPAKNQPRLPWFDLVLADIGDHQSLEQNLSTFSGHLSRIGIIFGVASQESLVLIDEICSGTDPSEGVALSSSILQYLSGRVNLAVVTTHYSDLSCLKDKDSRFQNAAMEFSLETLQPTFRILWGSTGDSNALAIAKSIGFNRNIIERARKWVEKLKPEKELERKGLLYQSLIEERNRLEGQARTAANLHAEIMEVYHEVQDEAEDLDRREAANKAKETQQVQQELKAANFQIETAVHDFETKLKTVSTDQYTSLVKKTESAIAAILEDHRPAEISLVSEQESSYTPQPGEQVQVQGLGNKLATVVGVPGDDETVLVQYGKIRVRVKKSNIRPAPSSKSNVASSIVPRSRRKHSKDIQSQLEEKNGEELSHGPAVQTSKNSVDLRGMRVEEAEHQLQMALSGRESRSVLFVIHGMGTGAVKERALEILRKHPRVAKFEQESPMNYGCTAAYIK